MLSLVYVPVYLAALSPQLLNVDLWVDVLHGLNQGVLNVVLGLWLWGYGVRTLGAAQAQRFPPLIPVAGTALAIPVLGEWPGALQSFGVVLIVSGLALPAFGDRFRSRKI